MNRKFLLTLISSPILFASVTSMVMMAVRPAHASPNVDPNGTHMACIKDTHTAAKRMVCERVSNTVNNVTVAMKPEVTKNDPNQPMELNFSDEESDEAIRLFGCDCAVCINAVRGLHGLAPMPI
jgi:hypothetical protein